MIYVFRIGKKLKVYEEHSISDALDSVVKRHMASYCGGYITLVATSDPQYLGKEYNLTQDGLYCLLELDEIKN